MRARCAIGPCQPVFGSRFDSCRRVRRRRLRDDDDKDEGEDACCCCSLGRAPGTSAMVLTFLYPPCVLHRRSCCHTLSLSFSLSLYLLNLPRALTTRKCESAERVLDARSAPPTLTPLLFQETAKSGKEKTKNGKDVDAVDEVRLYCPSLFLSASPSPESLLSSRIIGVHEPPRVCDLARRARWSASQFNGRISAVGV